MVAIQFIAVRRTVLTVGLLAACWSALCPPVQAAKDGAIFTVPNPLDAAGATRVENATRAARAKNPRLSYLIYDFNPQGKPSSSRDLYACAKLADYLSNLDVTTVAFARNEVTGHTVLPVLACTKLVMTPDAKLGDALRGQEKQTLNPEHAAFYETVIRHRKAQAGLIRKMVDRDIEVIQANLVGQATPWFVDKANPNRDGRVRIPQDQHVDLPAGKFGLYSAAEAKKYELCNLIVNNRQDLRREYHLTEQSLLADTLEGREPNAVRIHVRERLTAAYARTIRRIISKAIAGQANIIILQLECSGGDTQEARYLADELRKLKDDTGEYDVMTVAYIPSGQHAPDAVTFVALGCTQIVMGQAATLGDFDSIDAAHKDTVETLLAGLAKEREDDSVKLVHSFFHPTRLYKVRRSKGEGEWGVMTGEEVDADNKKEKEWSTEKTITTGARALTAQEAKDAELVQAIIDNEEELKGLYGLKQVRDVDPDFLYYFASFLADPVVGIFLIMIGIVCLILELKMPGLGVPGVIAALCFVLYFWAHSQLAGQITMLAILLFLLGLILIALEIFVVPGFGVTGISGIILVVVSLGLATLERKPETSQEWMGFGQTLGGIGVSLLGAVALAFLIVWYLPSIPYANRLVLKPPAESADPSESQDLTPDEEATLYPAAAALLGAIGVTATPLRPAGIARFGDDFIDVVSEGNYVPAGGRVQVIEIEGNRVVVKEV